MILKSSKHFIQWANILGVILLLAGLLPAAHGAQSLTLAWNPSSDSSVTGYRLHYGTTSGTYTTTLDLGKTSTVTLSNLTPGIPYYFVVTAYNASGAESTPTNEISATTNGSPTVVMSTPGNSINFNGPSMINLSATASEVGGSIAKVEFYSGNSKLGEATGAPYTAQWAAQPGVYSLSAVAYDASGEVVQSVPVSVTVTQPAITALERLNDGTYEMTLTGAPGRNNTVYVSNDLKTWTLLTSVMNSTGTLAVVDYEAASATRRFYRMVAE
ncbi:MAG: Ig-like domain-containing protein [Verrucomicrobiota bacterium]